MIELLKSLGITMIKPVNAKPVKAKRPISTSKLLKSMGIRVLC
ncbi:MAG: hypothetical protein WC307_06870 [Candidatus Nanoarchaeia archaeon]|jgi:hypothetical protein